MLCYLLNHNHLLNSTYLEGKEQPLKEQVVSNRKSRFSTPALPTNKDRGQDIVLVKANVRQESVTAGEWK